MYRIEYTDRLKGWTKSVEVYTCSEAEHLYRFHCPAWASKVVLFYPDGQVIREFRE